MPKTVTLRVDDETYRAFSQRAISEKRPIANFIEMAVMEYIRDSEFVEDEEMRDILSNDRLMRSLREGSKQAKKRQGRFVA